MNELEKYLKEHNAELCPMSGNSLRIDSFGNVTNFNFLSENNS